MPLANAGDRDTESVEEYLAFALENSHFATPVRFVNEILRVPPITELPRAPENVLGVANIRGEVLPVYDIKRRLGFGQATIVAGPQAKPLPKSARLVIMTTREGRAAVLVDAVSGVIRIPPPSPETPIEQSSTTLRSVRVRDQTYGLLNLEKAIS